MEGIGVLVQMFPHPVSYAPRGHFTPQASIHSNLMAWIERLGLPSWVPPECNLPVHCTCSRIGGPDLRHYTDLQIRHVILATRPRTCRTVMESKKYTVD